MKNRMLISDLECARQWLVSEGLTTKVDETSVYMCMREINDILRRLKEGEYEQ